MKEIGGYIELQLKNNKKVLHDDLIRINSGRNGIVYAIKAFGIKELWVPYYTCPVVWNAIEQVGCSLKYYSIDKNFMPIENFSKNDFILYTNYFGVCSKQILYLESLYPNLIVDNAQGFYQEPRGIASAYSPRKFFGVSDGGYVYSQKKLADEFERDYSYDRFSHLLKRIDVDSNFGYKDFIENDDSLINADIKIMSNLTQKILASIDYDEAKRKRIENFVYLKENLNMFNEMNVSISNDIPMYYPFLNKNKCLRKKLVDNKVYIPCCWKEMDKRCLSNSYELYLQENLLPLIIDQRYDLEDMKRMVSIIKSSM